MSTTLSFRVVEIDHYGHRVAPSNGEPWDKELANAVAMVAKAVFVLSKTLGKPTGSIKIDWGGSLAVVKVSNGRIQSIIIDETSGEAPKTSSAYSSVAYADT